MTTTKHIKKLAKELHEKDKQRKKYPNSEEFFVEILTELKDALLKGRYYTGIKTVSITGMSRRIGIYYIKNNQLRRVLHPLILKLAGCNKDGWITGCGEDMLHATQYNLFISLHESYKKANYQKRMSRYNSIDLID